MKNNPPKYSPLAMASQTYANDYGKKMKAFEKREQKKQIQINRDEK